ncbi:MAG: DUF1294 domain-containing protein [Planctomyces sp.]|nr:DUF1294 domain-containing protein [Planctomyces sp.]
MSLKHFLEDAADFVGTFLPFGLLIGGVGGLWWILPESVVSKVVDTLGPNLLSPRQWSFGSVCAVVLGLYVAFDVFRAAMRSVAVERKSSPVSYLMVVLLLLTLLAGLFADRLRALSDRMILDHGESRQVLAAGLILLPKYLAWLWISSCYAFLKFGDDKWRAENSAWRVTEKFLHGCELVGGWLGALYAMGTFHHKVSSEKLGFRVSSMMSFLGHAGICAAILLSARNRIAPLPGTDSYANRTWSEVLQRVDDGVASDGDVKAIVDILKSDDQEWRIKALQRVRQLGSTARDLAPSVEAVLRSSLPGSAESSGSEVLDVGTANAELFQESWVALSAIAPERQVELIPDLTLCLQRNDESWGSLDTEFAELVSAAIRDVGAPAVPRLISTLDARRPHPNALAIAEVLESISTTADQAIPSLERQALALDAGSPDVAQRLRDCLQRISVLPKGGNLVEQPTASSQTGSNAVPSLRTENSKQLPPAHLLDLEAQVRRLLIDAASNEASKYAPEQWDAAQKSVDKATGLMRSKDYLTAETFFRTSMDLLESAKSTAITNAAQSRLRDESRESLLAAFNLLPKAVREDRSLTVVQEIQEAIESASQLADNQQALQTYESARKHLRESESGLLQQVAEECLSKNDPDLCLKCLQRLTEMDPIPDTAEQLASRFETTFPDYWFQLSIETVDGSLQPEFQLEADSLRIRAAILTNRMDTARLEIRKAILVWHRLEQPALKDAWAVELLELTMLANDTANRDRLVELWIPTLIEGETRRVWEQIGWICGSVRRFCPGEMGARVLQQLEDHFVPSAKFEGTSEQQLFRICAAAAHGDIDEAAASARQLVETGAASVNNREIQGRACMYVALEASRRRDWRKTLEFATTSLSYRPARHRELPVFAALLVNLGLGGEIPLNWKDAYERSFTDPNPLWLPELRSLRSKKPWSDNSDTTIANAIQSGAGSPSARIRSSAKVHGINPGLSTPLFFHDSWIGLALAQAGVEWVPVRIQRFVSTRPEEYSITDSRFEKLKNLPADTPPYAAASLWRILGRSLQEETRTAESLVAHTNAVHQMSIVWQNIEYPTVNYFGGGVGIESAAARLTEPATRLAAAAEEMRDPKLSAQAWILAVSLAARGPGSNGGWSGAPEGEPWPGLLLLEVFAEMAKYESHAPLIENSVRNITASQDPDKPPTRNFPLLAVHPDADLMKEFDKASPSEPDIDTFRSWVLFWSFRAHQNLASTGKSHGNLRGLASRLQECAVNARSPFFIRRAVFALHDSGEPELALQLSEKLGDNSQFEVLSELVKLGSVEAAEKLIEQRYLMSEFLPDIVISLDHIGASNPKVAEAMKQWPQNLESPDSLIELAREMANASPPNRQPYAGGTIE